MKRMRKLIGAVTAVVCGMSAAVPLSASAEELFPENGTMATVYNSADINRNGSITTIDYDILRQYLRGQRFINYPSLMDVDGNKIVSPVDLDAVSAKLSNLNFWNYIDGFPIQFQCFNTNTAYTPFGQSTSETYYCHNFSNGTGTSQDTHYTLSMTETSMPSSSISPDSIIGDDDFQHETDSEIISGICRLSCGGTGFVVGDHVIATAAHCCVDKNGSTNIWEPDLKVSFPDSSGQIGSNSPTYNIIQAHIDDDFYNYHFTSTASTGYPSRIVPHDYALLTVSENLSSRYHFSLGIPYDIYSSSYFPWYDLYVTGFPADTSYNGKSVFTAHNHLYNDTTNPPNYNYLCYLTDTLGGDSGAPVYVKEDYKKGKVPLYSSTVIGINTAGGQYYNRGPYITPIMLTFYYNNHHISYSS